MEERSYLNNLDKVNLTYSLLVGGLAITVGKIFFLQEAPVVLWPFLILAAFYPLLFLLRREEERKGKVISSKIGKIFLIPVIEILAYFLSLVVFVLIKKLLLPNIPQLNIIHTLMVAVYFLSRNIIFSGIGNKILSIRIKVNSGKRVKVLIINLVNLVAVFSFLGGQFLIDELNLRWLFYIPVILIMTLFSIDFFPLLIGKKRFSFRMLDLDYISIGRA